jgi:tRNA threonylcarbamoyladenosine biosynthesis protein TsaB
MKLLAVDTALGACSVAILDNETVLAHHWEPMSRGHAEALAPMVDEAIREAGVSFSDLERLAVTTGPGTFTGQRVGIAFMRGLRLALGLPLLGVTTLEAMAAAAQAESGLSTIAVLHEAKRGEVYGLLVCEAKLLIPVQVAGFDDFVKEIAAALAAAPVAFAGTAAEDAATRHIELGGTAIVTTIRQPDALWVARLARGMPATGKVPGPLYLRAPDAKLPLRSAAAPDASVEPTKDGALLAALHKDCFSKAWDAPFFEQVVGAEGGFAAIATMGGRPAGFVLGRVAAGEAELLSIGVLPSHRQLGLGRKLLDAFATQAAALGATIAFLEVAVDNRAARKLYDGHEFRVVGSRTRYYQDEGGGDALVMRASLPVGNDAKLD